MPEKTGHKPTDDLIAEIFSGKLDLEQIRDEARHVNSTGAWMAVAEYVVAKYVDNPIDLVPCASYFQDLYVTSAIQFKCYEKWQENVKLKEENARLKIEVATMRQQAENMVRLGREGQL
ncbi:hypothetical protein HN958_04870 [Candidatus Falkowbacteria bacterium]|jgi:hypothetical protein|nr:hypothetical protein [Candidatus Falkowbacteria bacterium]